MSLHPFADTNRILRKETVGGMRCKDKARQSIFGCRKTKRLAIRLLSGGSIERSHRLSCQQAVAQDLP